jgi:hypothetical protein
MVGLFISSTLKVESIKDVDSDIVAESNIGEPPTEMMYFTNGCYAIAQTGGGTLFQLGNGFPIEKGSAGRNEIETMSLNYDGSILYAIDGGTVWNSKCQ